MPVEVDENRPKTEGFVVLLPRVIKGQLFRDVLELLYGEKKENGDLAPYGIGFSCIRRDVMDRPCGRWILEQVNKRNFKVNFSNRVVYETLKIMRKLDWVQHRSGLDFEITEDGEEALLEMRGFLLSSQSDLYIDMMGNDA